VSPTRNDQHKFREQLRMATGRDLRGEQARRRRTRNYAIAGVTATALAASGVTIVAPWKGGPTLVERAEAALTPPPNVVVHLKIRYTVRGLDTPAPNLEDAVGESWTLSNGRQIRGLQTFQPGRITAQCVFEPRGRPSLLEGGYRIDEKTPAGTEYLFDQKVGILKQSSRLTSRVIAPYLENRPETLRARLAQGVFGPTGPTRVRGRAVQRLSGQYDLRGQAVSETFFVDADTFEPVRRETTVDFEGMHLVSTMDFLLYEQLSATPENVALTSVTASHPTARIRDWTAVPDDQLPGTVESLCESEPSSSTP
jgi:hypothetical protein